jgi:predicted AAA+ superfamily ATPase
MYYSRLLDLCNKSFFLFGPRGSGKTTWIRHNLPDAKRIDLLDEEIYQRYLADPGAFAAELRAVSAGSWVVVDEIQRIPNLLNEVHRFIEEKGFKFVLCGSSSRKLKKAGVNLLAGRALHRLMHPFVPEEIGAAYNIHDVMRFGALPVVFDSGNEENKRDTVRSYARMYLKEEIQAEAVVRNLPAFSRFLPVAAVCHAETINVSGIARDAAVARSTVNGYIEILEDTLLCFRLNGYEAKARVKERKLPKLYWVDPGIVRAVKGALNAPVEEEKGALFEGLVGQTLRAYKDYRGICDEMFYWQAQSGLEVDFLLKKGKQLMGIEAKSGKRYSKKWCRGLRVLAGAVKLERSIVVYPEGPEMRTEDGIEVMPFEKFAEMLADGGIWRE